MDHILLPIIVLLNLSYIYFWGVTLYARSHGHIDRTPVTDGTIEYAKKVAQREGTPYLLTVQITTRGGCNDVVSRGIKHAIKACRKYPALRSIVLIEVITEAYDEAEELNKQFKDAVVPVKAYALPPLYETPNGTKLKARALHYMVEMHRQNPRDAYIIHYDEESVLTADNLARMAVNLLLHPAGVSEGTISYPLEWDEAQLLCRAMESNRPFGCHECFLMMTHPAPLHLHGSNLVVQERLENELGWDIGLFNGNALIAEDLVFGLMAYQKYGREAFGWHYVEMLEQPPFTIKAAFKQRERWVLGALQGVAHVRTLPTWRNLSLLDKIKVQLLIRLRIFTYAVGLPISILSVLAAVWQTGYTLLLWGMTGQWNFHVTMFAFPGLAMWIGATQLGLAQNLYYTNMTKLQRIVEHMKVLVAMPVAGLYETAGPFVACVKWMTGTRGIAWKPTPKIVGQEYEADSTVV